MYRNNYALALTLIGSTLLGQQTTQKSTWAPAKPTQTNATTTAATIGTQRQPEKPAWTSAKPTQTGEKSAVTIGAQRQPTAPATEEAIAETAAKKSKLQSAYSAAKKAAPELIKYAPTLIESGKAIAASVKGSPASTAQPMPQQQTGTPDAMASTVQEEEEDDDGTDMRDFYGK